MASFFFFRPNPGICFAHAKCLRWVGERYKTSPLFIHNVEHVNILTRKQSQVHVKKKTLINLRWKDILGHSQFVFYKNTTL